MTFDEVGVKKDELRSGESPGDDFAISKKFAGLILGSVDGDPDNARRALYLGCFPQPSTATLAA